MLDTLRGKNILITGGLGFIGSNLAARLLELDARVTLVDSLIPEYGGNLFNIREIRERVEVNISDVRDVNSMRWLVRGQHFLFNLAGQTSHFDSMADPLTDLEINCRAQLSILETCRKCNPEIKIVFASTRQLYGKPEYLPVDEQHRERPVDANGINKLAGESYHILYNNVYAIRSCALRLTNTYGPRMRIKDARQTFLGIWIRRLLEDRAFEVWDGRQKRDLTYIDDAVQALLLAAANDAANGQIFNTGGDGPISLKELAELIIGVNGEGAYEIKPFPPDRKAIDIDDYYADYSRIQSCLGWKPLVPLNEGLRLTLDYYRKHLEHYL